MTGTARRGEQTIALANHGSVNAVTRLDGTAPRDYDIEIELAHGRKINRARCTMGGPQPPFRL
ncbi:hypothetical protein BH23GEM2_BH23GEM2_23550 [soil metagenome]